MIIYLINYLVILTDIVFVLKTDNLKHGCSLAALKYCLGEISVIFWIIFSIININIEVEVDIVRFILFTLLISFSLLFFRQVKRGRNSVQVGFTRIRNTLWSLSSGNFFCSHKIYRFNISNLQRKYYEKY